MGREQRLPREMLYQLALYALGRGKGERASTILYPTVDEGAREQAITIQEPMHGVPQGTVTLRPLNLLKLDQLLRAGWSAQPQRMELAKQLVFGSATATPAA